MKFGLDQITINKFNSVFEKFEDIDEVIIYGSRAKGNFRAGSDIDITLKGKDISLNDLSKVASDLDDINTPYFFDISIFNKINSQEFLDHINRIGQTFYKKKHINMKIIVPMAGRGSRLRPHTLTIPKPLIPIAGKPIVHRLVEDIAAVINQPIDEIAFIIHKDFGEKVEKDLIAIAEKLGSHGTIYYQNEALGTAHAIMCAKESMSGPIVVAYADTLFRADFTLDTAFDSVIWVKQVEDPSAFGVVQLNDKNEIIDFVEKPETYVSDLAIIGIYYFKSGETLRSELQYLLDNNITKGGEYQLTDGLENMKVKGMKFAPGKVDEWMDCGNKNVTVETNSRMLQFLHNDGAMLISEHKKLTNSTIIEPCFIDSDVVLINSTVGPNVSLGKGCHVINSTIKNSLVQNHSNIKNANLNNAMIGNHASFDGDFTSISIGDYSVLE